MLEPVFHDFRGLLANSGTCKLQILHVLGKSFTIFYLHIQPLSSLLLSSEFKFNSLTAKIHYLQFQRPRILHMLGNLCLYIIQSNKRNTDVIGPSLAYSLRITAFAEFSPCSSSFCLGKKAFLHTTSVTSLTSTYNCATIAESITFFTGRIKETSKIRSKLLTVKDSQHQ